MKLPGSFRKLIFLCLYGLFAFAVKSQPLTSKIERLVKQVDSLTYASQYNSAQTQVLRYLEMENLTEMEIFYGHYLFADVLKSSGKAEKAVMRFHWCLRLLDVTYGAYSEYESLIEGKVAECYFDLMNYPEAKQHALRSIELSPVKSRRSGGHAVNYLILGYSDYLSNNSQSALAYYDKARAAYIQNGQECELPLVHTKIAQAYNALGSKSLSEDHISRAISISDSCGIDQYKLLTRRAMFEICEKNKDYKTALGLMLGINALVEKMELKRQAQLMDELEIRYASKLMQLENDGLQQLNQKNKEIMSKQKQALVIAVIAILILCGLMILLGNISNQRKKAERSLALLNAELEQKVAERTVHLNDANRKVQENVALLNFQNQQLMDFCNIISHNIRSPLVNMSMLINFIDAGKDEDERRQYIEKLKPVVGTLNDTFDELVESLQVRQDLSIKSEKIRLDDYLERTLEGLEGEIKASGAVITADFTAAPVIEYPAKYLRSIIQNLVSNAIKYRSPERGPVISLETRTEGGRVILAVKDNGMGIDLEKHGREVFQIRKVFHEHPGAKGFGLYITKTQVETMGGSIWVESVPGEGCTFFVAFAGQNKV